ncbi:MAG: hypothetical protein AB2792_10000 [Candidatus Thiodiazotropha sp.]
MPLAGYESEFPKYWDCKPYPPNDYNPTTEKDKCILDCMLKNSAMCTSIAMGTAGLGFTAGAVASIPGGGSFGPIGGKIGGTLGGMACAEALKMDCKEECKKKDQCN